MDAEIAKELFHTARRQHDASLRWSLTAIAILAFFHLLLFSPYVDLHSRHEAAQRQITDLEQQTEIAADLQTFLGDSDVSVRSQMDTRLNTFVLELRDDLTALDLTVRIIRGELPLPLDFSMVQGGLPDPIQIQQPSFDRSPVQTTAPIGLGGPSDLPFAITDRGIEEQVRDVADITAVRIVVRPLVEREILAPAFEALNRFWRDTLSTRIHMQMNAFLTRVAATPVDAPVRELALGITNLSHASDSVSFAPPADPYWWTSVEGKLGLAISISGAVQRDLMTPLALEAMTGHLDEMRARQQAIIAELEPELTQLTERFDQLQADLTSLGGGFNAIAVDLDGVATRFPLLLAMVLAIVTAWTAKRASELSFATRSLIAVQPGQGLSNWLERRVRMLTSPKLEGWVLASLAILWIGVSTLQLLSLPNRGVSSTLASFLVGVALIWVASWFRFRELKIT